MPGCRGMKVWLPYEEVLKTYYCIFILCFSKDLSIASMRTTLFYIMHGENSKRPRVSSWAFKIVVCDRLINRDSGVACRTCGIWEGIVNRYLLRLVPRHTE